MSQVVSTVMLLKIETNLGCDWRLPPGKYNVFGTPKVTRSISTEILIHGSATSTVQMPWGTRAKVESPSHIHIDFIEFSDDDVVYVNDANRKLSPIHEKCEDTFISVHHMDHHSTLNLSVHKKTSKFVSILECLRDMQSRPRARNELKFNNLNTIRCEAVRHLSQSFNKDVFFELPPLPSSASPSRSGANSISSSSVGRQLEGMDRKFDSYNWTHTHTPQTLQMISA